MMRRLFPISTIYDDYRRSRRDAPAADWRLKILKKPLPANRASKEVLIRGSSVHSTIFMIRW
jgi:hypothetical protein